MALGEALRSTPSVYSALERHASRSSCAALIWRAQSWSALPTGGNHNGNMVKCTDEHGQTIYANLDNAITLFRSFISRTVAYRRLDRRYS
jgi:hypothetical protein